MGWIIAANSLVIVLVAPLAAGSRPPGLAAPLHGRLDSVVTAIFIGSSASTRRPGGSCCRSGSGLGWRSSTPPTRARYLATPKDKIGGAGMTAMTARTEVTGVALSATLFTFLSAAGLGQGQIESPRR
jgi:hypothetical protein